jgi:hypothetical protein
MQRRYECCDRDVDKILRVRGPGKRSYFTTVFMAKREGTGKTDQDAEEKGLAHWLLKQQGWGTWGALCNEQIRGVIFMEDGYSEAKKKKKRRHFVLNNSLERIKSTVYRI